MKLYELADDLRTVETWLDEVGDELLANGGEIPEHIAELLAGAEAGFDEKVDRIARMIRNEEATAEAAKAEAARLTKRRNTAESRAKWLRGYLASWMLAAGRPKVKTPTASISARELDEKFRIVGDAAALYAACPDAVIVEQVVTTKTSPNDAWLAARKEAGEPLPDGIVAERGRSITIR